MFPLRNNIIRNLIKMGKPIKRTTPALAQPKQAKRSRTFATIAPQQSNQALKLAPTDVAEMRFEDLAKENLLHPALLKTITQDMKFDKMMPVCKPPFTQFNQSNIL